MAVNAKVASAYVDLVARTEAFEKSLDEAKGSVGRFKSTIRAEMHEAKGSIALLGEEVGIHLPRHLQTFLAGLPGVAPALSAAFSSVAVIALAGILIETGKKVYEFIEKNEEAAKKNQESWSHLKSSIEHTNQTLALSNSRIQDSIDKLEHKRENGLRTMLLESVEAADKLSEKLEEDLEKAGKLAVERKSSWIENMFGGGKDAIDQAAASAIGQVRSINEELERQKNEAGSMGEFNAAQQRAEAAIGNDKILNESIRQLQDAAEFGPKGDESVARAQKALHAITDVVSAMLGEGDLEQQKQKQKRLEAAPKSDHAFTVDTLALDQQQAIERENFRRGMEQSLLLWGPGNGPPLGWTGDQGPSNRDIFGDLRPKVELAASTFDKVHDAALDLADQFTNLSSTISHAMTRTIQEFNDTVLRAATGDHGGSFRQLAQHGAENLGRVGLQYAEGTLMKALLGDRHTKPDGSKANPIYTRDADKPAAAAGLAGTAGRGLLGILNDSNWFSSLFGGRLFGAGGIFGGGHALGGDVAAGVPIDVGELGPERFTPMVPGRITSAGAMGRGPSIGYIDARGTDPALVRYHVEAGMRMAHARAVHDATHLVADRQMRRPQ
jgi:hypothetical protein